MCCDPSPPCCPGPKLRCLFPVPCSQQLCELKMLQVCCVSPLGRNYTLFLATDGFSPSELTPRCYYRLWDQLRFQPGEEADQRWSVAVSSQLK